MRTSKFKIIPPKKGKRLSTEEVLALGREIQEYSRKNIKLPKNFDVVKFVRSCR